MKKTIFVSDLSGEPIEEGHEAQLVITYRENGRKLGYQLDLTKDEATELGSKGKARKFSTGRYGGRKAKTTSDSLSGFGS